MAHKKAGGSTSLGRDSKAKRLGVKLQHGQAIRAGQVIIKQRGTKYHPGLNVAKGADDTLFAKKAGFVKFTKKKARKFDGSLKLRTFVNVETKEEIKKTPIHKNSSAGRKKIIRK
jgi:large subunit ribosomal protein L27